MPKFSIPKFMPKIKKRHVEAGPIESGSIVGGNGWLAFKQALKIVENLTPGPLIPLKAAVVGVLAGMDHAERVTGSQEDLLKLAEKITGFKDIFLLYQSKPVLSSAMQDQLDLVLKEIEGINKTLTSKTERGLAERTIQAFSDIAELEEVVTKLDGVLNRFKLRINLDIQFEVNALAADGILSKLRHVPGAGINALDDEGCMDGTRVDLLESLKTWSKDRSEPPVFWLDGMAGTGKSAISRSFSRFLDKNRMLGGSFFCRRGDESRSDVKRILPTLAWFLARRDLSYREPLLQSLRNEPDLAYLSIDTQIKYLLEDPFTHEHADNGQIRRRRLVLVIDALDECTDDNQVRQLLDKILSLSRRLPLKFFLTSRPERHIRTRFESPGRGLHQILRLHDIEQHLVDADISHYFKKRLESIRTSTIAHFPEEWPSVQQVECLTRLAGKLFIYAFTAVKYIEEHNPINRLEDLTGVTSDPVDQMIYNNLDKMYALVLSAATDRRKFKKREIQETKRILTCVLVVREPLCVSGLAVLLGISPDDIRMNLDRLHAVISVPSSNDDRVVTTFHASFGDYLTTPERVPDDMLILCAVGHGDLANGCLQVMQKDLKFNVTNCKSSYLPNSEQGCAPITASLKYSCCHWGYHLLDAADEDTDSLLERMEKVLFSKILYWLEVLSVMGVYGLASRMVMRILTTESIKRRMNSDLVKFLKDANEFVTSFRDAISLSAPHIYISAMPFACEDSMIAKMFRSMFGGGFKLTLHEVKYQRRTILDLRGHTKDVYSVAFSPDGTRIVSVSDDKTIRVWDAETGEDAMAPLIGHTDAVRSVGFSPDGTCLVSGSSDKTIRVWDTRTGQEVMAPLIGHTDAVVSVGFSPDGAHILSGSLDRTIWVWNAGTGTEVMAPLIGHTDVVNSVGFSPDGTRIASGSSDWTIRVWDAETGSEVMAPLNGHTDIVYSVAFSPNGARIVSGSMDMTIRVWDAGTGAQVMAPLIGHSETVVSAAFTPDGTRIVSGSHDKTIRVWDAGTGEQMMAPLMGHTDTVSSVGFSPNGLRIVSGSHDETIRVWDAGTGEEVVAPFIGHREVDSVEFSPDGTRIVSGSSDWTIRVWDADTGEEAVAPLKGHTDAVLSVGFSPDGTRIVSGSMDKTIRVWDAETGEQMMPPLNQHSDSVYSVKYSPGGTRIVSGSSDTTIRVWDTETGEQTMASLHGHTNAVLSAVFSPDGARIVSGSFDKTIRVWDAGTGEETMAPLNGHTKAVVSVEFSPDGTRIVSGSMDKTIRLWDAGTGEQMMTPLNGHADTVRSVKYSPNGTRIVSGSYDKTIRVWDAGTGEQMMAPLIGHTDAVLSAGFSPDGTRIVSGSMDQTIRMWAPESVAPSSAGMQFDERHFLFSNHSGWITGPSGQLILWILPDHHRGLLIYPCQFVIGCSKVVVDWRQRISGSEWTTVYTPQS